MFSKSTVSTLHTRLNASRQMRFGRTPARVLRSCLVLMVIASVASLTTQAATLPSGFAETQVASGLSNPTAMAFAPDGRLFVCQQGGQVRIVKNGVLLSAPFLSVTTDPSGERGLLGLAFDPNFSTNGFIYLYYTVVSTPRHNRVSRFTASGDVVVAGSEVVILELNNLSATNHNGGAMHFGADGKLYIAVGENAVGSNSQTLSNLLGKILRINADGTIPSDNPFFTAAMGQNRAIWARGLRNPYTFAFQPATNRMFINDVGQDAWEEINDGISGSNYGWPDTEGPTTNPAYRSPLFAYGHGSGNTLGCAITGGTFYNPPANQFPASYVGHYFFADFCGGWIRKLNPADNSVTGFATGISLPVDLQVGPDGNLYYLARGGGTIFKIRSTVSQSGNVFEFGASQYNAAESAGSQLVVVRRTGDASGAATVDYAATNGSATDKGDYTTALGTLSFAANETVRTFEVLLTDDAFVEGNESLSLTLSNPTGGFSLGPVSTAQLTITDNDSSPSSINPIDNAQFFVRQHYHDFLNREPDQGGLDYWSQKISSCGANAACLDRERTAVSAAFFVEQEFQQTGFFLYRFQKAALGVRPSYLQFSRDRGSLQSALNLEAGKQSFAEAFVLRPEFIARYGAASSCAVFVDAVIDTVRQGSGVEMSGRRAELIGECNTYAGNTAVQRARVVRKLIEYAEFVSAEYNPAFVLTEYFGFLRREPDEGGYQFWLDVIRNRAPNNYLGMVQAFIISREYRERFGQP